MTNSIKKAKKSNFYNKIKKKNLLIINNHNKITKKIN